MSSRTIEIGYCGFMTTPATRSLQVLACNPSAIDDAARPRYQELRSRLLSAVRERRELPSGYAFLIDATAITLPEAAEWMDMERRCCPFLTLQLETSGNEENCWLSLSGPAGVKAFLAAELAF